ncbi:adenylate cyclase [Ferrimonas sediminum]|uniref:Adenylate cyclase n=1 Tax=Ferrimonas sediminum TaxID=718193 RepID=A0A1G8JW38_9GAMM|nr:class I adenylate cyclase [Ferrimonas sediminum]SDI34790.1 adenylate cyclase [Ferrimonas sediminum]
MNQVSADIALSNTLNQVRLKQFQQLLSPHQIAVLSTVIGALHCPESRALPGCPTAISGFVSPPLFRPSDDDLRHDGPLLGLYAMGSSGSLGQTRSSDVDLWLVHEDGLDSDTLEALQQKMQWLSRWATEQGLETHLFLINPCQFGQPCQRCLDKEHSGSAQHWLLLEEFYRTQTRLAGKALAWWPGAPTDHPALLSLGQIQHLPASEFFGAALWQLFKGIDRPHKSALKVLLLEAYVADYPDQRILRDQLWYGLKAGKSVQETDHYLMLYQRLEHYLSRQQEPSRLSMVQRCFYLKCHSNSAPVDLDDWRRRTLTKLAKQWQWTPLLIDSLDQAQNWHAGQVRWFNQQLQQLMLASYQRLTNFASGQRLPRQLQIQDMGILTRKLYTQFESEPDKLVRLNPLWSHGLVEPHLTLLQVDASDSHGGNWYLYRQQPDKRLLFGESPLFHHRSRLACIAWAAANGLVDFHTQIHCFNAGQGRSSRSLTRLARQFSQQLPQPEISDLEALQQPWHLDEITVVVNLEQDPSRHWHGSEAMLDLRGNKVLSTGRPKRPLIGSLELLCRNSWGELHYHSFDGEHGILEMLEQLMSGITNEHLPRVRVVSVGHRANRQITDKLQFLIEQCGRLRQQSRAEQLQVLPLTIGEHQYGLLFSSQGMHWRPAAELPPLPAPLREGTLQTLPQPHLGDDPYASAPAILRLHARKGMRQYFVRERQQGLDIYLLDENNVMQRFFHSVTQLSALIDNISDLYVFKQEGKFGGGSFNLPQFYRLKRCNGELTVMPLAESELLQLG